MSQWAEPYVDEGPAGPNIDYELTLWRQAGALFQIVIGAVLGFIAIGNPVLFIPAFWLILRGIRQSTGYAVRDHQPTDEPDSVPLSSLATVGFRAAGRPEFGIPRVRVLWLSLGQRRFRS